MQQIPGHRKKETYCYYIIYESNNCRFMDKASCDNGLFIMTESPRIE